MTEKKESNESPNIFNCKTDKELKEALIKIILSENSLVVSVDVTTRGIDIIYKIEINEQRI